MVVVGQDCPGPDLYTLGDTLLKKSVENSSPALGVGYVALMFEAGARQEIVFMIAIWVRR